MAQILVFGDSETYGAWDSEGGWVSRLRQFIDKTNKEHIIYNLGIDGNTTESLLIRFEFETKSRLWPDEETILLFQIGVNDSAIVSFEKFKENIKTLIKLAKKYSSKIAFLGLTSVDEKKTNPVPWNNAVFYKNEKIRKYNDAIKALCKENKVHFIEISNISLDEDGVHPNSKGHAKIFQLVKDFLVKNKII